MQEEPPFIHTCNLEIFSMTTIGIDRSSRLFIAAAVDALREGPGAGAKLSELLRDDAALRDEFARRFSECLRDDAKHRDEIAALYIERVYDSARLRALFPELFDAYASGCDGLAALWIEQMYDIAELRDKFAMLFGAPPLSKGAELRDDLAVLYHVRAWRRPYSRQICRAL
jgi:hypothetical protein